MKSGWGHDQGDCISCQKRGVFVRSDGQVRRSHTGVNKFLGAHITDHLHRAFQNFSGFERIISNYNVFRTDTNFHGRPFQFRWKVSGIQRKISIAKSEPSFVSKDFSLKKILRKSFGLRTRARPMATRKLPRFSLEQVFDPQSNGGLRDSFFCLLLPYAVHFESEPQILGPGHVGIESIPLKYHGHVPFPRSTSVNRSTVHEN